MKKLLTGAMAGALLLGGTTLVSAAADGEGPLNFGQMKPHIEEMHPELSIREQKQMFEDCHGENGMMSENGNGMHDRMNGL